MNRFPILPVVALAVAGVALPASAPVHASSSIQRCVTAEGSQIYTDAPCGRHGADASPLPSALLAWIARDEATERRRNPLVGTVDASRPPGAHVRPAGRRSPASGCARSPGQLIADLRGALALGDVNRIAESYQWTGMSAESGRRVMDRLQRLATSNVMDARYFGSRVAGLGGGASLVAKAGGGNGFLQLVLGDGKARSVVDFDVHRYAGCYFVSF